MWQVYSNDKGGWLQIFPRRINWFVLSSILLLLLSIALLPVRHALGFVVFLISSNILLNVSYFFIERNELEEIYSYLRNLKEGRELKSFTYKTPHFEDLKAQIQEIGTQLLDIKQKLENFKVLEESILSKIEEGVLIINQDGKIIFRNKLGETFLKLKERDYFYEAIRNSKLIELVSNALKGEKEIRDKIELNDIFYEVILTPLYLNQSKHILVIFKKVQEVEKETLLKTQFLEAVSHEMKTPLSSILGTIEILESENFIKKKGQNFLKILKENSERLQKLTERILKLSEIEASRENLREIVNLSKIAEGIVSRVKDRFEEKGLTLIVDIEEGVTIKGNHFFIEDVISNLLENALKYTEKGQVSLSVKKNENEAVVEVEDTGRGIKEENIKRIFEPFYREDTSRNEQIRGSGLGLTITKRIVELHNGEIIVKSKINKGTKFTIKFPLQN